MLGNSSMQRMLLLRRGVAFGSASKDLSRPVASCFSSERFFSTSGPESKQSLFLSDVRTGQSRKRVPLLLGLVNYFMRHIPSVGYFQAVGRPPVPGQAADRHVELIHNVFEMKGDKASMIGISDAEAQKLAASGHQSELLDHIYSSYAAYKEQREFTVVEGPGPLMGGTELDAQLAGAMGAPVLMGISTWPGMTADEYFNLAMAKRHLFAKQHTDVLGLVVNDVPEELRNELHAQLGERLEREGLPLLGMLPHDPLLDRIRLDEVKAALGADVLYGESALLDKDFSDVIVASQRVEEFLQHLEEASAGGRQPLVVTSQDRLDVVLALLAAQVSVKGPGIAGVLLTNGGKPRHTQWYTKDSIVSQIYQGVEMGGLYKGTVLPVLSTELSLFDAMTKVRGINPTILPSSTRKIRQCKMMFDRHIDVQRLERALRSRPTSTRVTPKMFMHNLKAQCLKKTQHIVLPESLDKRVLAAAADVSQRGLAKVTLLGAPSLVEAEAKKLGLDLSHCTIVDPQTSPMVEKYVDQLIAARGKKAPSREVAAESIKSDINLFGVMMVNNGDADGMVSGAMHTTAATIRPAMQVLKVPGGPTMVSSVFFMCLPDRVLVYGDCAVNPNPTSQELAHIAMCSHDTAKAFGVDARVAMCSYSTLGSGAGPDVQKVTDAVKLVKEKRPDIKVEGPIQYDAAIDPAIAAQKIKGKNEVAGKATVFVFPDLNTGNNTYKAVQQATGAIAIGPVMQGLAKPVNDLSRGCTIADIVNTICVTSIQAIQANEAAAAAAAATPSA